MSDKLTIDDEIAINEAITKAIGVGNGYYAPTECDADDATEAVMDYLKSRAKQSATKAHPTPNPTENTKMTNTMRKLPENDPRVIAFTKYADSDDYQNTAKWALEKQHTKGSLWAAFIAGYGANTSPTPPLTAETVEACAVELSNMLILRMDIDEDDPRLSIIIDEHIERLQALLAAPSDDAGLVELLDELQDAEANYRHCHDVYGSGDMKSGRAWDLMRRRGDAARSALATKEPTQ